MKKTMVYTIALMLAQAAAASAAVPGLINFQGRLLDSNKLPRTGTYSMTFKICDSLAGACNTPCAAGNACSWTEDQSLTVTNGVFAAQLGAVTPIGSDVFSAASRYLEITVAGETLSPRERLVAGSYSFRAGVADSLAANSGSITLTGGITASSATLTNTSGAGLAVSSSAYLASAGGKVGIGTTNPGEALEVNGNIKVGSATGGTVRGTAELVLRQDGDTYGATILRLRNRGGENGAIFDASEASVALVDFIFKDSSEQRNIRYESRAGSAKAGVPSFHIGGGSGGTASPDTPTLAVGDAYAAVASKLAVGSYNSPTQNLDVTGNSYFSGNVGIGLAPAARLHLPAGTAAAGTAPLKLTSGANLGTTEAGAVEFDGNHLYFTAADAGLRYQLDQQAGTPMTLTAIGSVPNANGMSFSSQQLNLQPADATFGGVVTTGAQIFAGAKTFNSAITGSVTGNAGTTTKTDDLATAVAVYPVWTTSAGNMADKVSTTKLSFIPNTGILSATGFAGPLTGNVSGNLTGTVLTPAQPNITSVGVLNGLLVANGAVTLDAGAAGNINIGTAATTGVIAIGSGTQTGNINIGDGTGAQTIHLGAGSTGIKNIVLGNAVSGTAITVNGDLFVGAADGRVLGINGLASGQTVHFRFGGDSSNEIQNSYGGQAIFKAYHGTEFQSYVSALTTVARIGIDGTVNSYFVGNVGAGVTSPTALMDVGPSSTARASLRLESGTGPTTPNEGDTWNDSTQKAIQHYVGGGEQTVPGVVFTQTAVKTVANTTTETTLVNTGVGSVTLPANLFVAGKTIRLTAAGYYGTTTTGPTMIMTVYLGATAIMLSPTTTITASQTTKPWNLSAVITCYSAGSSGTVWGQGSSIFTTGTTPYSINASLVDTAVKTVNTTTTQAVDLRAKWGTANAANTITLTNFVVEVLN